MTMPKDVLGRSFDAVAATYDASRPGYPDGLFDALERITGRPLAGTTVLDVGAGTGIATRLLHEWGARVTAVEPGAGMAARLRAGDPRAPLVRGDGNALPFADGSADLVTYAQSWHWTDPVRALPEAARVLRPGGALALWWNTPDLEVPAVREQETRLEGRLPGYHRSGLTAEAERIVTEAAPALGLRVATERLHWNRRVALDTHLAMLSSRSYLAVLGDSARLLLEDERAELLRVFPDGQVEESYALDLIVAVAG
jgi:SAM-dependent methyltransferase